MTKGMVKNVMQGHGLLHGKQAADLGKLGLRVAMGVVFLYHGWPKLANTASTIAFFEKIGIPAPGFFGPFVGVVESLGGALLILGAFTSFWGVALAIDMLVAIFVAKGIAAWGKIELDVMLLAGALLLAIEGAGRYSVDMMRKRK